MADTRIKDLAAFSGTPAATDFLAIDGPNETKKIPGNIFALDSKTKLNVTELGSSDDLNTLFGNDKSGFYYITRNVANAPDTFIGLIVIAKNDVTFQLAYRGNKIYIREYTGNSQSMTWSDWRKTLTDGENINIPYNVIIRSLYDRETNPSATVNGKALIFMDKDSERVGTIRVDRLSDGRNTLLLGVHNETTNGDEVSTWLQLYLGSDGTVTYGIPSPAKFRSAIDVEGHFVTERKSTTVSNATNKTDYHLTIDCTKQGYTPIGIAGMELAGDFYAHFHTAKQLINGNNAYVSVRANSETSFTCPTLTVSVFVLYRRNA